MPFKPGNKEASKRGKEKPYAEALRMELAAAGDDRKELRAIARAHIDAAKAGDLQAINALADRLDGKPVQESNVKVHRDVTELSDGEIAERIAELRGTGASDGDASAPIDPSQLN